MCIKKPFLLPALISGVCLILPCLVSAQTFTTLHSFKLSDGSNPYSALVLSGNILYGTTVAGGNTGGVNGNGTVFAINTDGSGFTNVYNFTSDGSPYYTNSDGANPYAGLFVSGNTLYGATYEGGGSAVGTLFAVNTSGTNFVTLHTFTGGNDGGGPDAGLILSGNLLYGTAAYGGTNGYGAVIVVNTNGTAFTNLYSFTNGPDGAGPAGVLILSGKTLYGTTSGGNSGSGSVFAVNTDGTGFTNLHSFTANSGFPLYTNKDGDSPEAGLVLSGSTLYGTASGGGSSGYGTLFAVSTNGKSFTTLYTFTNGTDGANPRGGLILSSNTLYGTAYNGGLGSGTVFAINTNGTGFTTLHVFALSNVYPYTNGDGAHPEGGLIFSNNTLYGTATAGGTPPPGFTANGTIFSISLGPAAPPKLTIVRSGTNAIVSWPSAVTGWTLQTNKNLATGAWGNYAGPVVNNTATNSSAGILFFRLTNL